MQESPQQQPPRHQPSEKQSLSQSYFPPTTQQYQYKIFINQCNRYIGSELLEVFRNDDEIEVNPNLITGTTDKNIKTIGELPVTNVIQSQNKRLYNAILKKSDIIVYVLNRQNAQEFQYLVKFLRRTVHQGTKPQRIICISSLVTWNGRRGSLQLTPSLDNLPNRNSSQHYLLQLQNLCLDINNLNVNIQSFVICSGLVYGCGQGELFYYFKKALQQEQKLKIYGNGANNIPMIHVKDLCNIVRDLAFNGYVGRTKPDKIPLPKSRYYFGVDNSKTSQKQLITCIAKNLGNGQVQQIPIQNAFLAKNFDQMAINLQVKDVPPLDNWYNNDGFVKNIPKIVSQFNLYRGLKPNKIFIMGPPASGKSKIAELLQKAYGLPVLTVKKVLQQIQNEQSQFANQIKIKLQQIRAQKIQEQRKVFQQAKKKKKGKKDPADQFDPSKIVPRLPDDQLARVFKRRLLKSDCLNKGYILDGWPKTGKYCKTLFTDQKGDIQENIFPNAAFIVTASQQQIKDRVKNLPQNIKETTHWNQQGTTRRLQTFNKLNQQGTIKSFLQGKVDIKDVPFQYDGPKQFIQFIQRNGPLGFKKKQKQPEKKQEKAPQKIQQKEKKQKREGQQQNEQDQYDQERNYHSIETDNGQFDLQKLTQHQKQILNQKSRPIRQYLIDNVIPQITQGLLEICKQTPRDPIEFLIQFLEKKETLKKKKK